MSDDFDRQHATPESASEETSALRVLQLGPIDFILLALVVVFLVYVVPIRARRWIRPTATPLAHKRD